MSGIRRLFTTLASFPPCWSHWQAHSPPAHRKPRRHRRPPQPTRRRVEPAIPNSKCFNCHDDAEMKNEAGKSVAVHEAQFAVSRAQEARLRRVPHGGPGREAQGQAPAARTGVLRRVHGMPRGRDHAVPGQRPRQGQGRQARDLRGLPRQRAHVRAQQQPECGDGAAQPGAQLRRLSRRHDGGLPLQRARQVAVRVGSHRCRALVQRLPRQPRHPARTTPRRAHLAQEEPRDLRRMPQGHPQGVGRERARRVVAAKARTARCAAPATRRTRSRIRRPSRCATQMPSDCGNCHDELYKIFHDSFHGKSTEVGRTAGGDVLGLPHAAPQPAGERPALDDPPGQPRHDLRRQQLPRRPRSTRRS